MESNKYYVITDCDDPYQNCLDYHGPFDTEDRAVREAEELSKVFTFNNKPLYTSVIIVKTIKF